VARDNAAEATMNTSTTTMETAAHVGRGFCLGGPTRSAHRPDGLRPPDGEQNANQRRTVRRPESKFLSLIARNGMTICRAALLVVAFISIESLTVVANDDEKMMSDAEVLKALESADTTRRFQALGRLFFMGKPEVVKVAIPSLIKLLEDPNTDVRASAVSILGLYPVEAKQALPELLKLMTDTKQRGDTRFVALGIVKNMRTEAKLVVPSLIEMLSLRNRNPRIVILPMGIGKLGSDDLRIMAADTLTDYGPEAKAAVPALIQIVKRTEETSEMQIAAIRALGEIGPSAKEAVPVLSESLQANSSGVRWHAAEALKRLGPEARNAVSALIASMKDKDREVRREAIRALGAIGPDAVAAVEPLQNALADEDAMLSSEARSALKKILPNGGKP